MQPRADAERPERWRAGGGRAARGPRSSGGWESALAGGAKERFESVLAALHPAAALVRAARRGGSKNATISDVITVPGAEGDSYLTSVVIGYADGDPDTYLLPHRVRQSRRGARRSWSAGRTPRSPGCGTRARRRAACSTTRSARRTSRRRCSARSLGASAPTSGRRIARRRDDARVRAPAGAGDGPPRGAAVGRGAEQQLGDLRRAADAQGVPPPRGGRQPRARGRPLPDREDALHADRAARRQPRVPAGAAASPSSIAILQGYVPNQGDAWQHTLNTRRALLQLPRARRACSRRP